MNGIIHVSNTTKPSREFSMDSSLSYVKLGDTLSNKCMHIIDLKGKCNNYSRKLSSTSTKRLYWMDEFSGIDKHPSKEACNFFDISMCSGTRVPPLLITNIRLSMYLSFLHVGSQLHAYSTIVFFVLLMQCMFNHVIL